MHLIVELTGAPLDRSYVTRTVDEKGVLLTAEVPQRYLGGVIGKKGDTATAIRTIMRAVGSRNNQYWSVKFVPKEEG
jgi:predicted RNA-binding protein YlqC (UPF0109 family)